MATDPKRYTRLMGLEVHDPAVYEKYRAAMKPFLEAHGGAFAVDLEVSRVLLSPVEGPINRVFIISFPSRDANERFLADPGYRAVRKQYFDASVTRASILGEWGG